MKKFIICTRGRTGSTAIIDELNKSEGLVAAQELFIPNNPKIGDKYPLGFFHPPFNQWKLENVTWVKYLPLINMEFWQAKKYLRHIEHECDEVGCEVFGFKVLTYHFNQRKYLSKLLQQLSYNKVIFLERNIFSQVISGMVAKETKLYNSTDEVSKERQCLIDIEKLKWQVRYTTKQVQKDHDFLISCGFDVKRVHYEDFVSDRKAFYKDIFNFVGYSGDIPDVTDFKVMIKNLRDTLINYDEVALCASELGFDIEG